MCQPGGCDPNRQRQVPAQPDHLSRGCWLRRHASHASHGAEQFQRLRGRQHVQRKHGGALDHAQPSPARDQHEAVGCTGQQRPDLSGCRRVVEHHQHLSSGQLRAPPSRPGVQPFRDHLRCYAEHPQQKLQRRFRFDRFGARRVGVQVTEELPVGVAFDHPMRCVHCQRGLANSGHPVDGIDHDRSVGAEQPVQIRGSAVEVGQVIRQGAGCLRGGRIESRVSTQQLLMQPDQLRAGVQTYLVGEQGAGLCVHRKRLRLPTAAIERHHQPRTQPFPQRVLRDHRRQLRSHRRGLPSGQPEVDQRLDSGEPAFVQSGCRRLQRPTIDPSQSRAPPERQRGREARDGGYGRALGEGRRVQGGVVQLGSVARAVGLDRARDLAPQIGDQLVDLMLCGRRRYAIPERVDQHVQRHHAPSGEQQGRQDLLRLWPAQRNSLLIIPDLQRAQHPKLHRQEAISPALPGGSSQ